MLMLHDILEYLDICYDIKINFSCSGIRSAPYLQDVALLDGGVLQLTGLLLQCLSCSADRQTGHYLLWEPEGALTLLHCCHLLLKALHFHQHALIVGQSRC